MEEKKKQLQQLIDEYTKKDVCIAFSGGIDSSYLLRLLADAAKNKGTKVYALTFDTVLHPRCDIDVAKKVAGESGADHYIIQINELDNKKILNNPRNRCYLCKKELFTKLLIFAKERRITTVLEGTNADDRMHYRPGLKAIEELGIKSPLAEAMVTKEEVRKWSGELGISVAQRPSSPCLATRLPYDSPIDLKLLHKIELGEEKLRNLGYYNIRLRVHGDLVRLEIDCTEFEKLLHEKDRVTSYLKEVGFRYITLDLEGFRSGSMD